MSSHLSVCRLCLASVDAQKVSLLNNNQNLTKSILHVTGIEVALDPFYHEYLCDPCQIALQQCVQFRTTCIHNDGVFKSMIIEEKSVEKCGSDQRQQTFSVEVEFCKVEIDNSDDALKIPTSLDITESQADVDNDFDWQNDGQKEEEEEVRKPSTKKKRKAKTDKVAVPKVKKKYQKSRKNSTQAQCQQCGVLVAQYKLKSHQEIHNPNRRKLKCTYCPKEYTCTKLFKQHVNAIHTHEIRYTCDQCGKYYYRPHSLKDHYQASHSGEKKFECKICGEKFTRAALRTHHQIQVHSSARPHACEYCNRTYKFKSDLTVHTRIHTGEKPFQCDICGKTFNKSYNVVIHKKSHRNDKNVSKAVVAL
ncbi:zinc finger protein 699-like isoform X2 [Armigeres subalbatus]